MENITFTQDLENINPEQLEGFFVDWQNPPTTETHLKLLKKSDYRILALCDKKVVGFITAITDETLSAYIPFLEVLPSYQKRGIGKDLVKQMLQQLEQYYMIDLLCDLELEAFYKSLNMENATGMRIRNYSKQSG